MAISNAETSKVIRLDVLVKEEKSVIVNLNGWRKRVYFDKDLDVNKVSQGQSINIEYTGDLDDVHSVKFLSLKEI